MEIQLLIDQDIFPTREVLKKVLGESYEAFDELTRSITDSESGLKMEWRYYKDGKAWLCKTTDIKKTIFWLSVWDKYFKTTFYFTEKTRPGILALDIDERIKERFRTSKFIGRLIPLTIYVERKKDINDVLKIAVYKRSLK